MSNAKHTPGPWTVGTMVNNDGGVSIVSDEDRVCSVDAIGDFPRGKGWKHEDAERDANARLIAAAPDLLEALRYLVMHCKGLDRFEGNPINEAIRAAREVLAKAEGR